LATRGLDPAPSLRRSGIVATLVAFAVAATLAVAGCGGATTTSSSSVAPDYQSVVRKRGEMCERLAPHTEVAQSNCEIELESAEEYAKERFGR
jgi:ABC-type glycerol-3-phosphate transport system substrate-binding protein